MEVGVRNREHRHIEAGQRASLSGDDIQHHGELVGGGIDRKETVQSRRPAKWLQIAGTPGRSPNGDAGPLDRPGEKPYVIGGEVATVVVDFLS
jgi:hypothetical protein